MFGKETLIDRVWYSDCLYFYRFGAEFFRHIPEERALTRNNASVLGLEGNFDRPILPPQRGVIVIGFERPKSYTHWGITKLESRRTNDLTLSAYVKERHLCGLCNLYLRHEFVLLFALLRRPLQTQPRMLPQRMKLYLRMALLREAQIVGGSEQISERVRGVVG